MSATRHERTTITLMQNIPVQAEPLAPKYFLKEKV